MPPTENSKISFAIKVYDTSRKKDKKKNQKSYCFKSKNNLQQVNKNLILVSFSRDENFKLKHLVKKTFEGIAFYKIESTSIEKKQK